MSYEARAVLCQGVHPCHAVLRRSGEAKRREAKRRREGSEEEREAKKGKRRREGSEEEKHRPVRWGKATRHGHAESET